MATALGGGYVASGPAGRDRLPEPYLPEGCASTARRAPARCRRRVIGTPTRTLRVGDRVYMRHAKAGELCEHFDSLHLVAGDRIVDEVPTYRGDGLSFL